ncbi:DUF4190 domain-containing protein [Actinotalea sp. C106]|uniref:DUF4190 domain-containing protein n=1 Tax=Actinotalea sp. C106 TaxID=2908644 RepID=UPI002029508B|nr:DUF4190 domain-containing protein [Actinotalea sp. C106]
MSTNPYVEKDPQPPGAEPGGDGLTSGPGGPTSALAVVALVIAVLSVLVAWIPFVGVLGLLGGLAAVVIGFTARRRARRGEASGPGLALAGVVVGAVAVLLGIGSTVLGFWLADQGSFSVDEEWAFEVGQDDARVPPVDPVPPPADDELGREDTGTPLPEEERDALADVPTLSVWDPAAVGPLQVTVKAANLRADAAIQEANEHNPEAAYGYVLVNLDVRNDGTEPVGLHEGYEVHLVTNNQVRYAPQSCAASVLPGSQVEPDLELEPTEETFTAVCFDVPGQRLGDVHVVVTDTTDPGAPPVVWDAN